MAEIVYPAAIGAAHCMFRLQGLRIDMAGTENVPRRGGAVMVSNHIGYLDFVFAGLTARPAKRLVRFMAKDTVFRHKLSGPPMRAMKHIPVNRAQGEEAYRQSLEALRAGEIVGVFPEATISQSFTLKSFKSGAARMAHEAGVPLLPVALWGTQRLWTKGRPRTLGRTRTAVSMKVGEPINAAPGERPGALSRRVRLKVEELLEDVQRGYPQKPSGPEDSWWLPAHLGGAAPTPDEAAALETAESKARRDR